ncbi:MAG: response regulator [Planctomycetes bacterium]|nr:response regulator [Planctomycetota bacterium]
MATILMADDEPAIAKLLEFKLKKWGHQVTVGGSGLDVLKHLETLRPDLIILDVMMPGMDGFTTLARLRATPAWADIPVVMATAKGQERDIEQGMATGAAAYIVKPFDFPAVEATLKRILEARGGAPRP